MAQRPSPMSIPDRDLTPRPNTGAPADPSLHSLPPRPLSFGQHLQSFQSDRPKYDESVYSHEDTPFAGIDQRTIREIRKRFDYGAKISDVVQKAIEAYNAGVGVDTTRFIEIITQIVVEDVLHNIGGTNVRGRGKEHLVHFSSMTYNISTQGESAEALFLIRVSFKSILPTGSTFNSTSSSTQPQETRAVLDPPLPQIDP